MIPNAFSAVNTAAEEAVIEIRRQVPLINKK
jgi:hypothetical protein